MVAQGTPGLTNASVILTRDVDDQTYSINITILKRLTNKIMVDFKMSKIEGKGMKKIFQVPKFNYCNMRRQGAAIPVMTDLFKAIEQYGNMVFKCPAVPGFYTLKDVQVIKLPIMNLFPTGVFVLNTDVTDDNLGPKPELILRFKMIITKK
jgi:Protein of unknown function (DUF1091)